ncbi:DUF4260 domain-containing protein [Brevibacillus dissolubilis]|uniref:DUF4260 domain-containing protein n=1 Tax=Brevibacillus dissolubilis TaxID=1844116 RepID=UPI001115BF84|nr:DUF4260 domain-containing protein [Brevibacillus dissolubilis]
MNKAILHLEGLFVLVLSVYFYNQVSADWLLFAILLLAPDIFMLGYLINPQIGSVLYNVGHTYVVVIPLLLYGILVQDNLVLSIGLIWAAHIGMDRLVGYGLKYPTGFKDTHLGRV